LPPHGFFVGGYLLYGLKPDSLKLYLVAGWGSAVTERPRNLAQIM
jgi:hypothetical protein